MRRLRGGRDDALGILYLRYASRLVRCAARSLGQAAAEDVVQDVMLLVWRHAHTFDPARGAFRPWVLQILRRRIVNELRRRGRQTRGEVTLDASRVAHVPDAGPEPLDVVWRNEIGSTVRVALDALPAAQRCAVRLAFLDGMTHQRVAAALDVPLGTVKTRIRSGLRQLRGRLAPLDGREDGHLPGAGRGPRAAAPASYTPRPSRSGEAATPPAGVRHDGCLQR